MKNINVCLPILIAIFAVFYSIGDYFSWWDFLSGRKNALISYHRLSSNKGYPEIFIKNTDAEYSRLYSFLIKRIDKKTIKELHKKGQRPKLIVRAGGTLGHELKKQIPPDYPDVRFAPDTLPVLFFYSSQDKDKVVRACNLEDLRFWIDESRNKERFIVTTIFIGILSIIVAILGTKRTYHVATPNHEQ